MSAEYYTVVYCVEGDKATQDAWWQTVQPLFLAKGGPVKVTAISNSDEITRLNCIEHVVEEPRHRDGYLSDDEKIAEIQDIIIHHDPFLWWKENVEPEPKP